MKTQTELIEAITDQVMKQLTATKYDPPDLARASRINRRIDDATRTGTQLLKVVHGAVSAAKGAPTEVTRPLKSALRNAQKAKDDLDEALAMAM